MGQDGDSPKNDNFHGYATSKWPLIRLSNTLTIQNQVIDRKSTKELARACATTSFYYEATLYVHIYIDLLLVWLKIDKRHFFTLYSFLLSHSIFSLRLIWCSSFKYEKKMMRYLWDENCGGGENAVFVTIWCVVLSTQISGSAMNLNIFQNFMTMKQFCGWKVVS